MYIDIDLKKFQHILAVKEAHISDKENGQICIPGYVWWNKTKWQSYLCTQSSEPFICMSLACWDIVFERARTLGRKI